MLKRIGRIEGFSSSLLEATGLVVHFFCSRKGGVSKGDFASLNLSFHVGDDEGDVTKNRTMVEEAFGLRRLVTLNQIHGSKIIVVDDVVDEKEGDGLITSLKGVALGILTADCLPILILAPDKKVIAALHGGWRGLMKGVIGKGIRRMKEQYGIRRERLLTAIGPHIKGCCYRVDSDVLELLKERYDLSKAYNREKGTLDLLSLALTDLEREGVKRENIEVVGECTSCNKEYLFSYRRDGRTGRLLSFIQLL